MCGEGFYRASNEHAAGADGGGRSACLDPRGVFPAHLREMCCVCPVGTDCSEGGTYLETLNMKRGYYRIDEQSAEYKTRRCSNPKGSQALSC